MTLKSKTTVTFHQMGEFKEMFKEYFDDFDLFHKSLSPEFNREMVFKAGEGAGRSGSFFFFSHCKTFIIKTMSKSELDLFLNLLPKFAEHYK